MKISKTKQMSKFKLNSEVENDHSFKKKHSTKKSYDSEDFSDFAYMSRGNAKNELRHLKEQYGL